MDRAKTTDGPQTADEYADVIVEMMSELKPAERPEVKGLLLDKFTLPELQTIAGATVKIAQEMSLALSMAIVGDGLVRLRPQGAWTPHTSGALGHGGPLSPEAVDMLIEKGRLKVTARWADETPRAVALVRP